jgi:NAD(P)-dependent dehydrogenase (short-subunit alcohol dehydrogenase family)
MKELSGKVAVITGGASGIGRGLATACRDAGMTVVIVDIERAPLDATAAELGVHGEQVDVTDAAAVVALAGRVQDRFGTCHLLCNNAGVGGGGRVDELTLNDWKWVIDVNLWGVVHGIHGFLPMMLANPDGGHIVNTASMAGLLPLPGAAPYAASKYAVVGLSETMREELAGSNLSVSVLCPGFVRTNIFTSQRNRPDALRNTDKKSQTARDANDHMIRLVEEQALDPLVVADAVLRAVQDDQFWVITHPDLVDIVQDRRQELFALGTAAASGK